jgi:hypothetical protein
MKPPVNKPGIPRSQWRRAICHGVDSMQFATSSRYCPDR